MVRVSKVTLGLQVRHNENCVKDLHERIRTNNSLIRNQYGCIVANVCLPLKRIWKRRAQQRNVSKKPTRTAWFSLRVIHTSCNIMAYFAMQNSWETGHFPVLSNNERPGGQTMKNIGYSTLIGRFSLTESLLFSMISLTITAARCCEKTIRDTIGMVNTNQPSRGTTSRRAVTWSIPAFEIHLPTTLTI